MPLSWTGRATGLTRTGPAEDTLPQISEYIVCAAVHKALVATLKADSEYVCSLAGAFLV